MSKYIIILSSDEQIPDDEFKEFITQIEEEHLTRNNYKVIEAMNLEGIREELWQMKKQIVNQYEATSRLNSIIEETFDEIKELFKLD